MKPALREVSIARSRRESGAAGAVIWFHSTCLFSHVFGDMEPASRVGRRILANAGGGRARFAPARRGRPWYHRGVDRGAILERPADAPAQTMPAGEG